MNYFIDSSVWIEYFKDKKYYYGDLIDSWIQEDKIYTNGIVIAELLTGSKNYQELNRLQVALGGLNYIDLDSELFLKIGYNGSIINQKGIRIPLSDLIIATACAQNNLILLENDRHFEIIKDILKIKLYD